MPSYGTIDLDLIKGWFKMDRADDGPVWCINLMKYRDRAEYGGDGGGAQHEAVSGQEADDKYAPVEVLDAIGAMVAHFGDVVDQTGAQPRWDRVATIRYPTRMAFIEMNDRKDFQDKHVHKEAGMEFTIIVAGQPVGPVTALDRATLKSGTVVMRVARLVPGGELTDVPGATRIATFTVEGRIIGDERTWDRVAFDFAPDAVVADALRADDPAVAEGYAITVRTRVDELARSVDEVRSA